MNQIQELQREVTTLCKTVETEGEAVKSLPLTDPARKAFQDGLPARMDEISQKQTALKAHSEYEEAMQRTTQLRREMDAPNYQHEHSSAQKAADVDARTMGERFVQSQSYQSRLGARTLTADNVKNIPLIIDMGRVDGGAIKSWMHNAQEGSAEAQKATFSTTAGIAPFIPRSPRIVPIGQIKPVIADLMTNTPTDIPGGKYLEETLYTNNAAAVPEGTLKPEAALGFTERQFSMAKIAVTIPVTEEQLADVPQVRGVIDNRLGLMVRQTEDAYLLTATLAGVGFDGFLVKSGTQQLTQGAAEPIPTVVLRAKTLVENSPGFANVTGIVMSPNVWFQYVTYQIGTGAYLVGSPDQSAITQIWGMQIIVTNRMPDNKILMGDFQQFAEILRREELNISVGWAGNDFLNNIIRIRAEERMVLQIFRANAFAVITGSGTSGAFL